MSRTFLLNLAMVVAVMLGSTHAVAADPSLQQVYQAAEAGNYKDAQGMMDQVLRDHPNSGKAHFVGAELLAKQGRIANAKAELETAERLAPGLPFAKPDAVGKLRTRLAESRNDGYHAPALVSSGFSWGLLLTGLALSIAIIVFFRSRNLASRGIPSVSGNTLYQGPGGPGAQPFGAGNVGPVPPTGGGMGSGVLGGLATGAAMGAGLVAGEALMHRMVEGGRPSDGLPVQPEQPLEDSQPEYDLGGNDFGVSDTSSWDDGSSGGGGDDWS